MAPQDRPPTLTMRPAPAGLAPRPLEKPGRRRGPRKAGCGKRVWARSPPPPPRLRPTPSFPGPARKRGALRTRGRRRRCRFGNGLRPVSRALGRRGCAVRLCPGPVEPSKCYPFHKKAFEAACGPIPGASGPQARVGPGSRAMGGRVGNPRRHEGAFPAPRWGVGSVAGAGSASPDGSPSWDRTPILTAQMGQARDNKATPRVTGESPPATWPLRRRTSREPLTPVARAAAERGGRPRSQV